LTAPSLAYLAAGTEPGTVSSNSRDGTQDGRRAACATGPTSNPGNDEQVELAIAWHGSIMRHSRAALKMLVRVQHPEIRLDIRAGPDHIS